jgi:YfiH family protein
MSSEWRIECRNDVRFATSALLSSISTIQHGFGLRYGGGDPQAALSHALGYTEPPFAVEQVHGSRIFRVDLAAREAAPPQADGMYGEAAQLSQQPLAIKTADCVPLLLASFDGRFVAAIHAGWRGTAAAIAVAALHAFESHGGLAGELRVAIGPAIGPCCYQVDQKVVDRVGATLGDSKAVAEPDGQAFRIDLQLSNRLQLERAGLDSTQISVAPWCTHCSDADFHSYRRAGDKAGRQWSLIGGSPAPA